MKPLAVIDTVENPALPGTRWITDYPEFGKYLPWGPFFGIFVQARTRPTTEWRQAGAAYAEGAKNPDFRKLIDDRGFKMMNISGAEAEAFLKKWQSVTSWLVHEAGIAKARRPSSASRSPDRNSKRSRRGPDAPTRGSAPVAATSVPGGSDARSSVRTPGRGRLHGPDAGRSLFLLRHAYGISGFEALSSPGAFPMAATAAMVVAALCHAGAYALRCRPRRGLRRLRARHPAQHRRPRHHRHRGLRALLETARLPARPRSCSCSVAIGCSIGAGPGSRAGLGRAVVAAVYIVFRLVFQVLLPEGVVPEREILACDRRMIAGPGDERGALRLPDGVVDPRNCSRSPRSAPSPASMSARSPACR
jgi:hypothetical protein